MRSLLGINAVPPVSRVSSIPNILNADRQILVILICVDFMFVQEIEGQHFQIYNLILFVPTFIVHFFSS